MRLAAAMCARVGEHEVALSLLRQALDRGRPVNTKSIDFHGQMVLTRYATPSPDTAPGCVPCLTAACDERQGHLVLAN